VALSSDGNTALIGGPVDAPGPDGDIGMGAAWVFARSGSTWTQQGPKLTASDVTAGIADFGSSVALSSDGNTALIGGPADRLPTFQQFNGVGAAWVFARSGSTWTQQGPKLTASDETGDGGFGWGVALSSDGNIALIGGPGDNSITGRGSVGAAWVFDRSGSTWTQQGSKLVPSDETPGSCAGQSVALSADANTALIGGPCDDPSGPGTQGAAWVFARSGSAWTQQGHKLTVAAGDIGMVGSSVALSSEGNTVLIAGPGSGRPDECPCGGAAVFIPGDTLSVATSGSGSGTVTSSPLGIRCGTRCTASYAAGTQVMLTAKPAAGSVFSGWGNGACSAERTCKVPLSFDRSVIAEFTLEPPKVTRATVDRQRGAATFKFKAPDATTVQCALLKPAHGTTHPKPRFTPCRSPKTYTHLKNGRYTFEVRAVAHGAGPAAKRRFSI
jgi:hypothetical protein